MFTDNELKVKLYIYPVLMFALGTLGFLNPGWEWFGVLLYVLGFVVALHIIFVSVLREGRYRIDAEANRETAKKEFYETILRMTPEEKYFLGLGYVPQEVTVKKDVTQEVGNALSQVWRKIPLASYKLKVVAQAALNGEGFTVRKWAGEGKLLSREEWDATQKAFIELDMLQPVGNDPREGFMWTSYGEDVLTQILKDSL